MVELLLDPAIRLWVILPIILITLMVGLVRHYITILLKSDRAPDLKELRDSQALIRSRYLRQNACFIPNESFLMRKHFFNNKENGVFKNRDDATPAPLSAMGDPSMAMDMLKGTLTNVLPMIAIGGWINWTFSGFLATKVPFPLTYRFKAMLQRGVELRTLSASWVSSMSWYFLTFVGLRGIYSLILGADNSADQTKQLAMQMSMQQPTMGPKQQSSQMFKGEWEALQVVEHKDALGKVCDELITQPGFYTRVPLTDPIRKKRL